MTFKFISPPHFFFFLVFLLLLLFCFVLGITPCYAQAVSVVGNTLMGYAGSNLGWFTCKVYLLFYLSSTKVSASFICKMGMRLAVGSSLT